MTILPSHRIVHASWFTLKITYGIACILVGLDKFFNILTQWSQYLNPKIPMMMHLSIQHFLYGVGILEILVGLLILSKCCTRMGALLLTVWLILIVANLLSLGGYYDIALRDILMAVGAWVLAELSKLEKEHHHALAPQS